jgi:hypothetical protein
LLKFYNLHSCETYINYLYIFQKTGILNLQGVNTGVKTSILYFAKDGKKTEEVEFSSIKKRLRKKLLKKKKVNQKVIRQIRNLKKT